MTAFMLILVFVSDIVEVARFRLSTQLPGHCHLVIIGQHWKR
jgi:hypothetical protein